MATQNLGRHVFSMASLGVLAKFIHIVRNPYVVYASMAQLYLTVLPVCQLDPVP